jgi:transcriptional regulator with XRE-family HTH domain
MEELAKRIKELRAERDLSLEMVVADMKDRFGDIKLDKSMISRWERGENDPSLENVKYLSSYFNVSVDYLIGLTDVRTPSRLLAYAKKLTESRTGKSLSDTYADDILKEIKS